MADTAPRDRRQATRDDDRTVGALELFFDLVFAYAMSQVTSLMLQNISWPGFGQGVLALAAIWWAWTAYAWLTNTFDHADPLGRLLIFLAMAAMLVAATALPDAFGDRAVVFACAYAIVRVIHVVLVVRAARGDEEVWNAVFRLAPLLLTGSALIVLGAFVASPLRELLWLASALIDFSGPLVIGAYGWRVFPRHFVQRHGLIVIIALGESIARVGEGAAANLDDPLTVLATVMAVLIAAGMWWAYFEPAPRAAEQLRWTDPARRARHARDAYSYLHMPLIGGIVFFALGVDGAVAHPTAPPEPPLAGVALAGGVAVFFFADLAYRWRDHHEVMVDRLVAGVTATALVPAATRMPALVTLGALLLICALRTAWEIRGDRRRRPHRAVHTKR